MLNPRITIVPQPLYNYIDNNTSTMHTYDKRIYQIYNILEDIEQFARQHQVYSQNHDYIELISICHILISTTYRASFRKDFNPKIIKAIFKYVSSKYPNWYHNQYIKLLSPICRIYLYLLQNHHYYILYLIIKTLHKKIKL